MNDDAFKLQTLERAVYMDGWMDGCVCGVFVCECTNASSINRNDKTIEIEI